MVKAKAKIEIEDDAGQVRGRRAEFFRRCLREMQVGDKFSIVDDTPEQARTRERRVHGTAQLDKVSYSIRSHPFIRRDLMEIGIITEIERLK